MRVHLLFAVAGSLLGGCGGVVLDSQSTAGDAGTEVRIERPEPEGGTEPVACNRTNDRATISLSGRVTSTCDSPGADAGTPSELVGQIVRTDASSFDLDMCSPAADCIPLIVTVQVSAVGLDLRALKQRSFVKVEYRSQNFFGCHQSIAVTSIDSWAGEKNPVDVGGRVYLAAGEGMDPTLPFTVDRVATHCFSPTTGSCGGGIEPDWYTYRFAGTEVPMGATSTFTANGQKLTARNLRAFYQGDCDAYWDFAFWLVAE